jgi:hypothetical protein
MLQEVSSSKARHLSIRISQHPSSPTTTVIVLPEEEMHAEQGSIKEAPSRHLCNLMQALYEDDQ